MSNIVNLSYKDRSALTQLLMKRLPLQQYQRAQAVVLLDGGESVEEVAEQLQVSRQTVYNWVTYYQQRSALPILDRLQDAPRSGRPVIAKGVIDPLINKIIDEDPRNYGFNSTGWTAELLRRYLSKYHHCDISVRSIGYAIARLQIRWKLPRYVLSRQDPFWQQAKGGLKRASGHIRAR